MSNNYTPERAMGHDVNSIESSSSLHKLDEGINNNDSLAPESDLF